MIAGAGPLTLQRELKLGFGLCFMDFVSCLLIFNLQVTSKGDKCEIITLV